MREPTMDELREGLRAIVQACDREDRGVAHGKLPNVRATIIRAVALIQESAPRLHGHTTDAKPLGRIEIEGGVARVTWADGLTIPRGTVDMFERLVLEWLTPPQGVDFTPPVSEGFYRDHVLPAMEALDPDQEPTCGTCRWWGVGLEIEDREDPPLEVARCSANPPAIAPPADPDGSRLMGEWPWTETFDTCRHFTRRAKP